VSFRSIPKGTPGRGLFFMSFGVCVPAILLIIVLAPTYAKSRDWPAIYLTIAFVGWAVGSALTTVGMVRIRRHRRAELSSHSDDQ